MKALTLLTFAIALSLPLTATAQQPPKPRNIVLIHGAWADGSSWAEVIPLLQEKGYNVTAVQNPLTSLAASVAETRRVLSEQDGPTVLVGHSWGGTVISEVGGDPKVTALVYVAARAPDAGEDFNALQATYPTTPVRAGVVTRDGFSTVGEQAFLSHFANGVPERKARVLYAVQQPIAATLMADKTTTAAWRSKPSWYLVSKQDQTISPELQRFVAKRMKAHTVEVDAGHLSMVSHPREVAEQILLAGQESGGG